MAGFAATSPVGTDEPNHLRRAVIAATVGTSIEWYDFFLYSSVTGLVFAKLYFPNSDPLVGLLNAFAIYAVGFLARPVGAAIFGHYGDRIGRKATLIATLLLMGIATFLVGFVPGYASIGVWGAIILSVLRFIQGVGVGGEWGGSVLLAMEWARTNQRRGLIASWPQFGVPAGLILANGAVLIFSGLAGPAFIEWGWRIPFFLSIVLVAVGLWIRLGISETPTFRRLTEENRIERAPVSEVLRLQGKAVLLSALARMAEQAPFYIFTTFIFAYATSVLGQTRNFVLTSVIFAALGSIIWIPMSGQLSDRIGRKKMYLYGAATTLVFGFIYFGLLNTMSAALIFLAIFLSLIPHDMQYGPQAALIAEQFTPRMRYSGASLGYQLASVIAGGPAPLIATWLYGTYKSPWPIAIYIAICGVISLAAVSAMRDYTGVSIHEEYDLEGSAARRTPAGAV